MTPQELLELEKRLREADCQALEGYRKGLNEAPILYKPGFIKAASGGKGEPMVFVASEESEDRMGDVICCAGWDLSNFKKNPVYMFMHNYALPPVGRVPKVWTEGKQLLNTVEWDGADPMAQQLQRKYAEGFMRAESVGFRPMEFKDAGNASGGYRFEKQELLEISAVPIPAHPAALAKMLVPTTLTFVMPGLPEAVKAPISWASAHPNGTPAADRGAEWDAGREVATASVDDLKIMAAWVDPENRDNKGGYKLPHHKAGGDHAVVFKALAAVVAVLNGGRGGADIPDADRQGIYTHIARHFRDDFDAEAPPLKGVKEMPEKKDMGQMMGKMRQHMADMRELMGQMGETMADMEGMVEEEAAKAKTMKESVGKMRGHLDDMNGSMDGMDETMDDMEGGKKPKKSGGDLPQTKAGAVLNRTNKGRLNQAKELIDQVLESAGKPEAEEEEPKGLSPDESAAIGEAIRLLGQAAK